MAKNVLTNLMVFSLLAPVAVAASSASKILDVGGVSSAGGNGTPGEGYGILLHAGTAGATLDGSNKVLFTLQESDTTADAAFTDVASTDYKYGIAAGAGTANTLDANSKATNSHRWEYIGSKRYIRLKYTVTGTVSIPLSIQGLLGTLRVNPASTPAVGITAT